jgi:hypothetical protein
MRITSDAATAAPTKDPIQATAGHRELQMPKAVQTLQNKGQPEIRQQPRIAQGDDAEVGECAVCKRAVAAQHVNDRCRLRRCRLQRLRQCAPRDEGGNAADAQMAKIRTPAEGELQNSAKHGCEHRGKGHDRPDVRQPRPARAPARDRARSRAAARLPSAAKRLRGACGNQGIDVRRDRTKRAGDAKGECCQQHRL